MVSLNVGIVFKCVNEGVYIVFGLKNDRELMDIINFKGEPPLREHGIQLKSHRYQEKLQDFL